MVLWICFLWTTSTSLAASINMHHDARYDDLNPLDFPRDEIDGYYRDNVEYFGENKENFMSIYGDKCILIRTNVDEH